MFLTFTTKNLNWEILTKNLVTFKRWHMAEYEFFIFLGGHEKQYIRG